MSPQFTPQRSRPLRRESYLAAARRFRQLCDLIEQYSDPQTTRDKAQLTRAIHGLAYGAKDLSARHRRATQSSGTREAQECRADPGRGVRET